MSGIKYRKTHEKDSLFQSQSLVSWADKETDPTLNERLELLVVSPSSIEESCLGCKALRYPFE